MMYETHGCWQLRGRMDECQHAWTQRTSALVLAIAAVN